jgi:hypothetical protein
VSERILARANVLFETRQNTAPTRLARTSETSMPSFPRGLPLSCLTSPKSRSSCGVGSGGFGDRSVASESTNSVVLELGPHDLDQLAGPTCADPKSDA